MNTDTKGNKGRKFYACAKPRDEDERCDFFHWACGPAPDFTPIPVQNSNLNAVFSQIEICDDAPSETIHEIYFFWIVKIS